MKISKELFIESINAIQQQKGLDSKCTDAFRTILQHDYISGYDNSIVVEQMIKLLEDLTRDLTGDEKDSVAGSWIGYFIYELDFGSKYEPGRIKAKDDTNIPLATPEDLWNILLTEYVQRLQ